MKKVSCQLYFLRQLPRSQVMPEELMLFYITILKYPCPVFHRALAPGLPQREPGKTAKTCIANYLPWYVIQSGPRIWPTLFKRREEISKKLFNEVMGDPGHTLHKLLPPKNPANCFLRRNRDFALPLCKIN